MDIAFELTRYMDCSFFRGHGKLSVRMDIHFHGSVPPSPWQTTSSMQTGESRMRNRLLHAVTALVFTLCVIGYAAAQTPPPEPPMTEGFQVKSTLSGAQEVAPPVGSTLTGGEATIEFDAGLSQAEVTLTLAGDAAAANAAHLHCNRAGADGPVFLGLVEPGTCDPAQLAAGTLTCTLTNESFNADADCLGTVGRPINNIASLFFAARDGLVYINVHTTANPGGEIRGQLIESDDTDAENIPQ